MTDMQRWGHPDPDGSMHLYPLGPYVFYDEAEAAIAAAEQQAHWLIAALVHLYGGAVTITVRDLLALDRNPVLERFDNPDGSITLRALQEKP